MLPSSFAWPARRALLLVPLLFGLLSLALGQDDNWDLHNYHFYNPYALLNGKIGYDLAPGQWQSYFNPTLDLLYYALVQTLAAPVAGLVMGFLHGLNFLLLLALTRQLLPAAPERTAWLLALAGMLGPGFLSELGNTMGDNLTALLVLAALLLVLKRWGQLAQGAVAGAIPAGILMGAACGLKLTNATYAVALCLALLLLPGAWWQRLRAAFVFGLGVLGGIALTAGHWYWRMWQTFGNPLFPQFNNLFHGPLAAPVGIGDTGWLPHGLMERLLWPFLFTLDPSRVIELPLRQLIWPLLYLAFLAFAVCSVLRRVRRAPPADADAGAGPASGLLLFFALAYLCWLNLFSIYRYLVPLELLAPTVLWLLLHRLLPARQARLAAVALLVLALAVGLHRVNWGHGHWRRVAFSAEVPALAAPREDLVLTVHGNPPMSWLVPLFPRELAFVALGSGFPESPAYVARLQQMVAQRHGTLYVLMQAGSPTPQGQADVLRSGAEVLSRYGFTLDHTTCRRYGAWVGSNSYPYQLCVVRRLNPR